MTLSPETMFEQMITEMELKPQKEFRILKSHLNHNTMSRALVKKPKILVINCHGGVEYQGNSTQFWFEDVEQPTLVDKFSEKRLLGMFQPNSYDNPLTSVKLVIVSACHSSRLGKIFHDAKIPSVVSISASTQVLELAAKEFNVEFLHYLLEGWSVKKAFDQAILKLKTNKDALHKSCCCDHKHTADCLWMKYQTQAKDLDLAHSLHDKPCKCKQTDCIDHEIGCSAYTEFYKKLIKGLGDSKNEDENTELVMEY